jgi:hypothetical protein
LNRIYGLLGTATAVACEEPSIVNWLDEFLIPAFEVLRAGSPADFHVTIHADPSAYATIAAKRPNSPLPPKGCFALDQEVVAHPHWRAAGRVVLDDARLGAFYALEGRRAEVFLEPGSPRARSAAMRVIRESASVRALKDPDLLLLHAAALEHRGRAVLIAGPKGSGKTTSLLYLAAASGARILANDRALLHLGGAEIEVQGMPTVVSIRDGTLELLRLPRLHALRRTPSPSRHTLAEIEALAADAHEMPTEPFRVSPAQLAYVAGVSLSARGRLSAILFPEARPGEASVRLDRLSASEATRRLQSARFGIASAKAAPTVFEELLQRERAEDREQRWLAELGRCAPCFNIALGPHAYRESAAGLDLVERLTREAPA